MSFMSTILFLDWDLSYVQGIWLNQYVHSVCSNLVALNKLSKL